MKNTFAEYVAKRDRINEDLSWLPSVPLIGWAAGAVASAAFLAFRRWAERNAKSRREYQDMADWWRILDKLIEMGNSRAIKDHMKLTEQHPYDVIKRMAEIHLADAKKETVAGVRESYDELPVDDEYSARLSHDELEDRGVDRKRGRLIF